MGELTLIEQDDRYLLTGLETEVEYLKSQFRYEQALSLASNVAKTEDLRLINKVTQDRNE